MSAIATGVHRRAVRANWSAVEPGSTVRLTAFAGLCAFSAWRYATIEARPPMLRVCAIVVVAVVAAAGMIAIAARGGGRRRTRRDAAACLIVIALLMTAAVLVAGLPARLLVPTGWERLGGGVHRGAGTIATTLWPYVGSSYWTRLDILLALSVVSVLAAAIGFWPARDRGQAAVLRSGARRITALALLITLYVLGVLDSNGGSATLQGLLLLALVAGWLWLPGLRARTVLAAFTWLLLAGALAALLTVDVSSSQSWLNYRAWNLLGVGQPATAFSWDQTYGPITWPRSRRTMFTVRAPAPGLWKLTTLDRFDGLRFVRSGTDPATEADLPLPLNDRWYQFATFAIAGLGSRVLPTEQGTTGGVRFGGALRYGADGTVSTFNRPLRAGDSYSVMSYVPQPTAAELRVAPRTFPAAVLRYTDFDLPATTQSGLRVAVTDPARPGVFVTGQTVGAPAPGLGPAAVPRLARRIMASPYGPIYRLARRIAAGMHSPYDVAIAVQNYLKANYAYNEQPPRRRYPLAGFLFLDRIGYCQQFSGAMALMLRMDGIPARVAAGFHTGSYDSSTGSYRVSALDAHSWVEVYFTGIGWVPFDPTPPRSAATKRYSPLALQTSPDAIQAIAATVGGAPAVARAPVTEARHHVTASKADAGRFALLAAGAVALLAVLALAARWGVGRVWLSRSLGGDGELASRELLRALPMLGYDLPATVTLAQIERLVRVHGGPDAARYVRLLRERRYGAGPTAPVTLSARRRLRRGLTAHLGIDHRLRGQWALPPGTIAGKVRPS